MKFAVILGYWLLFWRKKHYFNLKYPSTIDEVKFNQIIYTFYA